MAYAPFTRTAIFVAGFAVVMFAAGCRKAEEPARAQRPRMLSEGTFNPYDTARVIVDTVRIDLDRDGISELVVTSRDKAIAPDPLLPKTFDRLEVFRFDTARKVFTTFFIDPVESGSAVTFTDVTRRGLAEIVVTTNAGGNDPIASQGMSVFGSKADGRFTIIFYANSGAPEIRDLNGDRVPEILVTEEYWGVMSHDEAIAYTASVHSFDGNEFVENNLRFSAHFDAEIGRCRAAYQRAKTAKGKSAADFSFETYKAFTELLLWLIAKGDLYEVRRVWGVEKQFLSLRLSAEQYEDLDGLVQDSLAEQQQAAADEVLQ
ncbi:MAG: hypothetical protein IPP94_01330 [Ignavibacteria bacterium]|nr:hypothetical protein [Ignavibacteria bacterium]